MSKKISWIQNINSGEEANYTKDTNRRFFDRKLFFYISLGVIFLIEAIVAISFCASTDASVYMIGPLSLTAIDLAFMILSRFLNFRRKYAKGWFIGYIAISAIMTVVTLALAFAYDGVLVMSISAAVITAIVQAAKIVIIAIAIKTSKRGWQDGRKYTLNGVICASVAGLLFVAFLVFGYFYGFMGQGTRFLSKQATLTFSENERGEYVVSGTLGDGNLVVVPKEFNGKTVAGLDASLLNDTRIDALNIECDDFAIYNIDALKKINKNISVKISKLAINEVRESLFKRAGSNAAVKTLFSNVSPNNLAENENYFNYDYTGSLPNNPVYVPTVIVKDGLPFDPTAAYKGMHGYFEYVNTKSSSDLLWNWYYNDGYILDESAIKVDGNLVCLSFDKVYYLNSQDGNDAMWRTSVASKYICSADLGEYFEALPKRDGFDVVWSADGNAINSSAHLKELLSEKQGRQIRIAPQWTLKAPVIRVEANDRHITYGQNTFVSVGFTCDVAFESSLYHRGTKIASTTDAVIGEFTQNSQSMQAYFTEFALNGYNPTQSDEYEIRVLAKDPSLTSLVSETVTSAFDFTIDKKDLHFYWNVPDGETYNGAAKDVSCTFNSVDVVDSNDVIDFAASATQVTNAGNHTVTVSLVGECDNLYYIKTGSSVSFEILQKPVSLDWNALSSEQLIYDGNEKPVFATVNNLEGSDFCVVSVRIDSQNRKNAGDVTYTAYSLSNPNYTLESGANLENTYTITPLQLSFDWIHPDDCTYNGNQRIATVGYNNRVFYDDCSVVVEHTDNVNVGEVTVTATGLSGDDAYNYYLPSDGLQTSFTITPRVIVLAWTDFSASELIYDGNEKSVSATVANICVGDECVVSIRRTSENSVHAGEISYEAYEVSNSNYQLADSNLDKTYAITPRPLVVEWTLPADLTYDGAPKTAEPSFSNTVSGDSIFFELSTQSPDNVNAGNVTYIITSLVSGLPEERRYDYYVPTESMSVSFVIRPRTAQISWTLPQNLVYDGAEKIATLSFDNCVEGDDCQISVTHTDAVHAGEVTYSAIGFIGAKRDNYRLPANASATFTITPAYLTVSWLVPTNAIYDGSAKVATATLVGIIGDDICQAVLQYSNSVDDGTLTLVGDSVNAGSVTVTVVALAGEDSSNYALSPQVAAARFDIARADRICSVSVEDWTYGGTPSAHSISHEKGDTVRPSFEYSKKGANEFTSAVPSAAGEYTVRATIPKSRNFNSAVCNADFTINKLTANFKWGFYDDDIYDGAEKVVGVVVDNLVGNDVCELQYEITSANRFGAGEVVYAVTSVANPNYSLDSASLNSINKITIKPRIATLVWRLNGDGVYDGRDKSAVATVNNLIDGDVCSVTVEITSNNRKNAGTVTFAARSLSNGNYALDNRTSNVIASFTISQRVATLNWIVDDEYIYDGREKTVRATVSNLIAPDTCTVNVEITSQNRVHAGEVTYTATSLSNSDYKLASNNVSRTITIKKAVRTGVTLTINGWTQGEQANQPQLGGYTGEASFTYATAGGGEFSATVPTQAGNYVVKATIPESADYEELTLTATFTISADGQGEN